VGSGGWLEADLVAEGFEFCDEAPGFPVGVQAAGEEVGAELNAAGALDWSKAVIDGSHIRALKGGPKPGRARSTVPGPARSTT